MLATKRDGTARPRELQMVDPLDYLILQELPEEGAQAGLIPLGITTKHLRKMGKFDGLSSDLLSGRLRNMAHYGVTKTVNLVPVSAGKGFQITEKGQRLLDEWLRDKGGE